MAIFTLYLWDFGDGYTSKEENPVHDYEREGTYLVRLTQWTELGSVVTTGTVTVLASTVIENELFTLRYAVEQTQGQGWSEVSGSGWLKPKLNYGVMLIVDDNDTPRMLIEDADTDEIWEDATFDRVEFQRSAFVDKYYEESLRNANYRWLASAGGTNEYYLDKIDGGDPELEHPNEVAIATVVATEGEAGTLVAGTWAYGDNDTLGYDTLYVRLPDDTDPDTKAVDYVYGYFWTEIPLEMHTKEEIPNDALQENKFEVTESHIFTRPQDPENKGNDNYNDNGYRELQEIDLEAYVDGTLTRPFASIDDIPENGDAMFSGSKVEGRRIQFVVKAATSDIQIAGRNHAVIVKPKQGSRTERETTADTIESEFSVPEFRISRHAITPLLERVSKTVLTGTYTTITGPDARENSAVLLTAQLALLNDAVAGVYTVMFWRRTSDPAGVAALPALTQYGDTFDTWQLMYVTGTNCPANLIISAGSFFDFIILNSNIVAYLPSYYNDVRYAEELKQLLPGF